MGIFLWLIRHNDPFLPIKVYEWSSGGWVNWIWINILLHCLLNNWMLVHLAYNKAEYVMTKISVAKDGWLKRKHRGEWWLDLVWWGTHRYNPTQALSQYGPIFCTTTVRCHFCITFYSKKISITSNNATEKKNKWMFYYLVASNS